LRFRAPLPASRAYFFAGGIKEKNRTVGADAVRFVITFVNVGLDIPGDSFNALVVP
jgi:hypothetical protein